MDTSLPAPGGAASPLSGLAALPVRQLLVLVFGIAALAAVIAAAFLYSKQSDYRVLFANLEDRDGGAVVAALTQLEVPYRFAAGGGAILVPGDRVHDVRLKLAGQGLPRGGTIGFEILDSQKLGVTQFQERLNFQRGLEGELARSIQSLAAVRSARVHLAIPNTSAFVRKRQPPSASVLLNLHGGRALERGQVAGIVNLVAASVPELTPGRVSVIDQDGMLLSNRDSADHGLDSAQLDYAQRIEAGYIDRIVAILEPIVGKGNVRAQVTAEVDFTQQESTAEVYRPNQGGEPVAIRSQQLSIDRSGAGGAVAEGIPGALSNQPPAAARAPANGPPQETGAGASGEAGTAASQARRNSVTNYEVDKTIRVTRSPTGTVKRVAAAVLVDYRRDVDAEGKEAQVALSPAELESINALVREAIGFTEARGDSLSVLNTPFTREEVPPLPEVPAWKDPEVIDTARAFGKHLGLLVLGLATILMVIRPALRTLRTPATPNPAARLQQVVGDDISLPTPEAKPMLAPNPHADVLQLARDNPGTVANVIRGWVSNEERQDR